MTDREKEILELRNQRLSIRQIAKQLGITFQYVSQVCNKLNVGGYNWDLDFRQVKASRKRPVGHPKRKRKCLGCGKKYGTREMRTHQCSVNWYKRIGWVYSREKKRYIAP